MTSMNMSEDEMDKVISDLQRDLKKCKTVEQYKARMESALRYYLPSTTASEPTAPAENPVSNLPLPIDVIKKDTIPLPINVIKKDKIPLPAPIVTKTSVSYSIAQPQHNFAQYYVYPDIAAKLSVIEQKLIKLEVDIAQELVHKEWAEKMKCMEKRRKMREPRLTSKDYLSSLDSEHLKLTKNERKRRQEYLK